MSSQSEIEFSSKHCKFNSHKSCIGRWTGLGFNIKCICPCHSEKRDGEINKSYDVNIMQNDISYLNGGNDYKIERNKSIQDSIELSKSDQKYTSEKGSTKLQFPLVSLYEFGHAIKSEVDSIHV